MRTGCTACKKETLIKLIRVSFFAISGLSYQNVVFPFLLTKNVNISKMKMIFNLWETKRSPIP